MITAGVDAGNKFTKAVILEDGRVLAVSAVLSGFDRTAAAAEALVSALNKAGKGRDDVQHVTATGSGKNEVPFALSIITEISADARGALYLFPAVRTVVDVGAEEGRALKCNGEGRIVDFAVNDKCAAGAGSFIETMARALETNVEEMGALSLKSTRIIPMNAQCAVFAESEVVSLIHARTPREDIARAVHNAIAGRVISLVRRVGLQKDLVLVGGLARNDGFVRAMEEGLGVKVLVPEDPEYIAALGAALVAAQRAAAGK